MLQFFICKRHGNGRQQRTLGPSICNEVGKKTDYHTKMDCMWNCLRGNYAAPLVFPWFIDFIGLSHGGNLDRNPEYSSIPGRSCQSADFIVSSIGYP